MKTNKLSYRITLAGFLLIIGVAPLLAQFDTATVLGTVRDASGSVLTGTDITLTNQGTGISAKTKTDESGNYNFTNVKIGLYTVTAVAAGFSRAVAKDIKVDVNARQRVELS